MFKGSKGRGLMVAWAELIKKVESYEMPEAAQSLIRQNPPMLLAGITAAGKQAISDCIEKNSNYRRIVTHTTRPMRPGEVDGREYWFVDEDKMLNMLSNGEMIEVAVVHKTAVNGSSLKAYQRVIDGGFVPLYEIDIQGMEEILKAAPSLSPYFLLPPSFDIWLARLNGRSQMTREERTRRFESAQAELLAVLKDDRYKLIINNKLGSATQAILDGDIPDQDAARDLIRNLLNSIKKYI